MDTSNQANDNRATQAVAERAPPAAADTSGLQTVPGAETLGRGIYIRPQQAYELRSHVVRRAPGGARPAPVSNSTRVWAVPSDCVVNDSPPLPAGRAIGQTIIEESWYRFGREVSTNVHAAANAKVVTIDATSFQGSTLNIEEDAYYALRSSFIPFWNVYLPQIRPESVSRDFAEQFNALPEEPYDPLRRADYARIFDRFGTHVVTSAWLGGKASLTFVVTKSSNVSKEDLKLGIEAAFGGGAVSGGMSRQASEAQSRVRNNSTCNVFGSGGDATELAKLTTLKAEQYDTWINSVKQNPSIIELGVVGIWSLLPDPVRGEALRRAYIEESTFSPLAALVPFRDWMVILKGDRAFDYALTTRYGQSRLYTLSSLFKREEILEPGKLEDGLKALTPLLDQGDLHDEVDSLLKSRPTEADVTKVRAWLVRVLNQFLLSGASVLDQPGLKKMYEKDRKNWRPQTVEMLERATSPSVLLNRLLLEEIFPTQIARRPAWLTLTSYLPLLAAPKLTDFDRPHAALSLSGFGGGLSSRLYLFRWRKCLRIDLDKMAVDEGYPADVADEWPEVDFDRIDAAVAVAPNRLYFFRGSEYIRYDFDGRKFRFFTRDLVSNRWPGVVFETIDTAAYWGSNKVYFFSGDQYIRYDLAAHRADPGYPKFLTSNYVEDWEIFE